MRVYKQLKYSIFSFLFNFISREQPLIDLIFLQICVQPGKAPDPDCGQGTNAPPRATAPPRHHSLMATQV